MDEKNLDSYLKECINVNAGAIDDEYVKLPADMAFWGERFIEAQQSYLLAKLVAKETRARTYLVSREKGKEGSGRLTEGMIEAIVDCDPDVHQAEMDLIFAEIKKSKLHQVTESLKAKKDLIIQLGASLRAQMQGDPVLRTDTRNMRQANNSR